MMNRVYWGALEDQPSCDSHTCGECKTYPILACAVKSKTADLYTMRLPRSRNTHPSAENVCPLVAFSDISENQRGIVAMTPSKRD